MENKEVEKNHVLIAEGRRWFRPARFWNYFAAYYPISWEGWTVVLFALATVVVIFYTLEESIHSFLQSGLIIIPVVLFVALILDVIMRTKDEYPWWWRHKDSQR